MIRDSVEPRRHPRVHHSALLLLALLAALVAVYG